MDALSGIILRNSEKIFTNQSEDHGDHSHASYTVALAGVGLRPICDQIHDFLDAGNVEYQVLSTSA